MANDDFPFLDPKKGEWDQQAMSRRQFLGAGFWMVTSIATLPVGAAGARFLAGNSFDSETNHWVEIGKLAALNPTQVNRVNYSVRATDAWREVEHTGTLYTFSEDDGATYTVLDATCTHLGCVVQWQSGDNQFSCPCHSGHFTREGDVIDGPPPKPLRRLPTKIENDTLWAQI